VAGRLPSSSASGRCGALDTIPTDADPVETKKRLCPTLVAADRSTAFAGVASGLARYFLAKPHFLPETGLSQRPVSRQAENMPLQAGSHCSDVLNCYRIAGKPSADLSRKAGVPAAAGDIKLRQTPTKAICATSLRHLSNSP
jgi:hypothetical protein